MTHRGWRDLTLGFARGGSFSYLAIEGGMQGEPMFGSLAVNARAGLGSPYPRPLQAGDELQTAAASGAAERGSNFPPTSDGPIRVVMGPAGRRIRRRRQKAVSRQRVEDIGDQRSHGLPARRSRHQASARPQHRFRRHRERQHPGARQRRADRADAGPRHQRRLSQDRDRDLRRFRPVRADPGRDARSASRPSAWPRRRRRRANSPSCCAPCPTGCDASKTLISTSRRCTMPMSPATPSARSTPEPGKSGADAPAQD